MAPLVNDAQVKSASLHRPLPILFKTYVWPFAIIWPLFLAAYLQPGTRERYFGPAPTALSNSSIAISNSTSPKIVDPSTSAVNLTTSAAGAGPALSSSSALSAWEWTVVYCGIILTAQALTWLATKWNVNVRAAFTTLRTNNIRAARLIKIVPVANAGSPEICLIEDHAGKATGSRNGPRSFVFQKRRFMFDEATASFAPPQYPLDASPKPVIGQFQESRGLADATEVEKRRQLYGDNAFDIPIPSFTELFKEHAVAPFFIFQIFCVGLWLLDEYWYYSLFTLFMLVVFESTVVWQRQRTLSEFRSMSIKPYDIWAFRMGTWSQVQTDKLLPGDVVSISRTKEDSGIACDVLLLDGSAIVNEAMLSGESTPVLKDSIQLRPADAPVDIEGMDKNSLVYGGTKVLQVTREATDAETDASVGTARSNKTLPTPPDNGAVAVVVRTGFETSQGSLVRTMIYSTEHVSANNLEALVFILFMLVFAIAASWYVWQEGVAKDRKRSKLLLDCVLIVTSVVPPELPMELSLAVNTSLAALSKYAIFCTEPFRIPYAGRVDIACFDKTGTLTGEDLVVEGVAGLALGQTERKGTFDRDGAQTDLTHVADTGPETTLVLASAHALVKLDEGDVVGEPMERATLGSLGWTLGKHDILTSKSPALMSRSESTAGGTSTLPEQVQIKRRFQFSSSLKRQSSVAVVTVFNKQTSKRSKSTFVGVKGAPETIRKMLVGTSVPKYEETFKYFTRNGGRVLALAYKYLSKDGELGQNKINNLKREDVECDLQFAGFLVLQCPLKEDAKKAVQMLNWSSHRVIMITGDNPLTAVHVARQVDIIDREVLILDAAEQDDGAGKDGSGTDLVWRSVDDKISIPVDLDEDINRDLLETKDICLTGYGLSKMRGRKAWPTLLKHTWVYARVSPKQKEEIILGLKDVGYTTLMCGDGTNDVGALKQAHVGVALLNGTKEDLDRISDHFRTTKMKEMYEKQAQVMKRFNQPAPPVPLVIAHLYPPGQTNPHHAKAVERETAKGRKVASLEAAPAPAGAVTGPSISANGSATQSTAVDAKQSQPGLSAEEQRRLAANDAAISFADSLAGDEPPTIKLGDASVAAPFTSKLANVVAIPNIIRQGRCTLVATIQMYKILALNCLISAYSLSVLYLDGIKFGDGQVTISGMLMNVCFLSISRAKPVEKLSKERPQNNIFNLYIIGSVLGQFAIHILTMHYLSRYVQAREPLPANVDLEGEFKPSLLNSAIYLLTLIQQISTFALNYQGRPFRESIRENRAMYWGLVLVAAVAFSCATEFIPEVNSRLKLVPFTTDFKLTLTGIMIIDYAGCWIVENSLKTLFSDYKPTDIARRRPDQIRRQEEAEAEEVAATLAAEKEKRSVVISTPEAKALINEKNGLLPSPGQNQGLGQADSAKDRSGLNKRKREHRKVAAA